MANFFLADQKFFRKLIYDGQFFLFFADQKFFRKLSICGCIKHGFTKSNLASKNKVGVPKCFFDVPKTLQIARVITDKLMNRNI